MKEQNEPKKIVENDLVKQVMRLEEENNQLKKFVQQQSMNIEQVISRLNRVDQMQIQMDVMLRNHQHKEANP